MKRLTPLFLLGLFTVGAVGMIGVDASIAQAGGADASVSNTVIVYRWNSIPWQTIFMRWGAVLGFTWLIGSGARYSQWNGAYWLGAVLGSVGLFLIKPLFILGMPHWPLDLIGSAVPEMGSVVLTRPGLLSPLTASALIPFLMLSFLLSHAGFRWITIGVSVGMAAALGISVFTHPYLAWMGSGFWAQLFLAVNAALSLLIAYLGLKTITESA